MKVAGQRKGRGIATSGLSIRQFSVDATDGALGNIALAEVLFR